MRFGGKGSYFLWDWAEEVGGSAAEGWVEGMEIALRMDWFLCVVVVVTVRETGLVGMWALEEDLMAEERITF